MNLAKDERIQTAGLIGGLLALTALTIMVIRSKPVANLLVSVKNKVAK